jgi:hypothetical protein
MEDPQLSVKYIAGSEWGTNGDVAVRTSYPQVILDGPITNCMSQEWLAP